MTRVFIGVGGNLGDREKNLEDAISLLREKVSVLKVSSIYETEPVGEILDQPWFLNCVVKIETDLEAEKLFEQLLEIEKELKRVRTVRDAPRTIDLDILLFGDQIIETEKLTIPHPRMCERRFVLEPLKEIAPDFIHPVEQKTIAELLEDLENTEKVRLYGKLSLNPEGA